MDGKFHPEDTFPEDIFGMLDAMCQECSTAAQLRIHNTMQQATNDQQFQHPGWMLIWQHLQWKAKSMQAESIADPEDCASKVMIRLLEKPEILLSFIGFSHDHPEVPPRVLFAHWLATMLRNSWYDAIRAINRHPTVQFPILAEADASTIGVVLSDPTYRDAAQRELAAQRLAMCIQFFVANRTLRRAHYLWLRHFKQWDIVRIAQQYSVSTHTVEQQISRAREDLRQYLYRLDPTFRHQKQHHAKKTGSSHSHRQGADKGGTSDV